MRDRKEYNGWTNRATWVFNLHFEEDLYLIALAAFTNYVEHTRESNTAPMPKQYWCLTLKHKISVASQDFCDEINEQIFSLLNEVPILQMYAQDIMDDHNIDHMFIAEHYLDTIMNDNKDVVNTLTFSDAIQEAI